MPALRAAAFILDCPAVPFSPAGKLLDMRFAAGKRGTAMAKASSPAASAIAAAGSMRRAGMCGGRCAAMDCDVQKAARYGASPACNTRET